MKYIFVESIQFRKLTNSTKIKSLIHIILFGLLKIFLRFFILICTHKDLNPNLVESLSMTKGKLQALRLLTEEEEEEVAVA